MKKNQEDSIKLFLVELSLYAVLVTGYLLLNLHFLSHWLKELFDAHNVYYAFVALGLIVFQGVLLESLTTALVKLVRTKIR
jgi:hypothetical protein